MERCPADARNPCDNNNSGQDNKSVKSLKILQREVKNLSDAERIERLEKEVNILRNDIDRIKYEQAIAETAIGRAIIRGSASLNETYGLSGCPKSNRYPQLENVVASPKITDSDKKSKENKTKSAKDECGGFTLG